MAMISDRESNSTSEIPLVRVEIVVRTRSGRTHKSVLETDSPMEVENIAAQVLANPPGYFSMSLPGETLFISTPEIESIKITERAPR